MSFLWLPSRPIEHDSIGYGEFHMNVLLDLSNQAKVRRTVSREDEVKETMSRQDRGTKR